MLDDYGALIVQGWSASLKIRKPRNRRDHRPDAEGRSSVARQHCSTARTARDRGIGRRMIAFAESEARRLGFAEIRLYTHEKMIENIALYTGSALSKPAAVRGRLQPRIHDEAPWLKSRRLFSIIYIMRLQGIELNGCARVLCDSAATTEGNGRGLAVRFRLSIEDSPSWHERNVVDERLGDYNAPFLRDPRYDYFGIFVRDPAIQSALG